MTTPATPVSSAPVIALLGRPFVVAQRRTFEHEIHIAKLLRRSGLAAVLARPPAERAAHADAALGRLLDSGCTLALLTAQLVEEGGTWSIDGAGALERELAGATDLGHKAEIAEALKALLFAMFAPTMAATVTETAAEPAPGTESETT